MKLVNKIFSILLPIIILAFALYPCADRFEVPVSTSYTTYLTSQPVKSNHLVDTCSPLCACTCCAASTIASIILDIDLAIYKSEFSYTPIYYIGHTNGANLSIWQPPKIA